MSFQVAGADHSSQSAFVLPRRSTQSPLRTRSSCPLQHWTASCRLDFFGRAQSTRILSATVSSSAPVSTFAEQLLEVGRVLTTHGIKGEIKVEALTDFPEQRLTEPGTRWLQAGGLPPKQYFLERGRATVSKGRDIWIVKLQGVNSLNDSQLLRGTILLVDSADRPELEDEDEFLAQDLIGASVVLHMSGSAIGTVLDVYDGTGPGAHDLLQIELSQNPLETSLEPRTMLLPFVKEFVPIVDVEDNAIHVCPPAGLIDMALQPKVRAKGKRLTRTTKTV